jgi:hypothetical protein
MQKYYWTRINEVLEWEATGDPNFSSLLVHVRTTAKLNSIDYNQDSEDEKDHTFSAALSVARGSNITPS